MSIGLLCLLEIYRKLTFSLCGVKFKETENVNIGKLTKRLCRQITVSVSNARFLYGLHCCGFRFSCQSIHKSHCNHILRFEYKIHAPIESGSHTKQTVINITAAAIAIRWINANNTEMSELKDNGACKC